MECREMTRQEFTYIDNLIKRLPTQITQENEYNVIAILHALSEFVEALLADYEVLFLPFYRMGDSWQNMYCSDFTWKKFVSELIERETICIKTQTKEILDGVKLPTIQFFEKGNEKASYIIDSVLYD